MNKTCTLILLLFTTILSVHAQAPCSDGLKANAGPSVFYCSGGSAVLGYVPAATGGHPPYRYTWSPAGAINSPYVSNPVTKTQTNTQYTLVVLDSTNCSASSTTTVTVNPLPVATVTANGPLTFCKGGTVKLTAAAASAYKWNSGQTTRSITVKASGDFIVTVTSDSGCTAASTAEIVSVNPLPEASIKADSIVICTGDSAKLTANSGTGYKYLWTTGQTARIIYVKTAGACDVQVTNTEGCSKVSAAIDIGTVNCKEGDIVIADKTNGDLSTAQGAGTGLQTAVYPNPFNGAFHIKVQSDVTDNISIRVYDVSGTLVEEKLNISFAPEITLGNTYANGVYVVQVQQNETSRQMRVVKTE
jgi:hypothetical protein